MKVLVTAKGAGLGAWLEPSFSDCKHFVIVDEHGKFEEWGPGEQIDKDVFSLAERIISLNINALITGKLPANIEEIFRKNNIQVLTAERGSVLELVERYQAK